MTDYVILINDKQAFCRICYEEDNINNMIYPCKCNGNIKYVHPTCLNKWRKTNNIRCKKCEICLYEYVINDNNINLHRIHKIYEKNASFILILYLLFIFVISAIFYGCDMNHYYGQFFITRDVSYYVYYRIYFITIFLFVYMLNLVIILMNTVYNYKMYCSNCICFKKNKITDLYKLLLLFIFIIVSFLYGNNFYDLNSGYDIIYSLIIMDLTNRTHISIVNDINSNINLDEPVIMNYE
jgi:hypothetical protein